MGLIAKFYNPVGLIQLVFIKLQLLLQKVCLTNVDWDSKITGQLKENWQLIVKFVENLAGICINTCYFYDVEPRDYIVSYQLHGLSDASEKAYWCCIYLKYITKNNFISSLLVASKCTVAPKRKLSIPRLELLGNLILSSLILTVLNAFQGEIVISCLYARTDSKVSLAWAKTLHKEFKIFVQNGVVEIRKNISPESWSYCSTKVNPSDLITRLDKNIDLSKNSPWWRGPCFLFNKNQSCTKVIIVKIKKRSQIVSHLSLKEK